jgi:hypothetical protein
LDLDFQLTADSADLALREGSADGVRESIEAAVQVFLGSWEYDTRDGVAYLQAADPGAEPLLRASLYSTIIGTPGVSAVESLQITRDRTTRRASVHWRVKTIYGSVGSVSNPLEGL